MLELQAVSTGYGPQTVVRDVDLTLRAGEIVALIGANGAGKSTLVKAISGLLPTLSGEIRLSGRRIDRLGPRGRVLLGVAHVPEGRQVFSRLTVAENLRLGAYAQMRSLGATELARRRDAVCTLFPLLKERMHEPAAFLSGGQQQMLSIARGLMSEPKLLLLDEPSLGLAPLLVTEIFRHIEGLRARGLTVLLSEQNARLSLAIADRGYVVESGRVVLEGKGSDLLGKAEVVERYLGIGKGVKAGDDDRHKALVTKLQATIARPSDSR